MSDDSNGAAEDLRRAWEERRKKHEGNGQYVNHTGATSSATPA
jgi:hypothetical protein